MVLCGGRTDILRFLVQKLDVRTGNLVDRVLFACLLVSPLALLHTAHQGHQTPLFAVFQHEFRLIAEHRAVEKVRVRIAVTLEIAVHHQTDNGHRLFAVLAAPFGIFGQATDQNNLI